MRTSFKINNGHFGVVQVHKEPNSLWMLKLTWICELLYKNGYNELCKSRFLLLNLEPACLFLKGPTAVNVKIEKSCLCFPTSPSLQASKTHLFPHSIWPAPTFSQCSMAKNHFFLLYPLSKSEESNQIKLICTKLCMMEFLQEYFHFSIFFSIFILSLMHVMTHIHNFM